MAASVQPPARPGGGRRSRARKHTPMHEINVTPFVDVMLVLLIVFMVTAPLLLTGLPVDLPVLGDPLSVNKDPMTVTVDRGGKIYVGSAEEEISVDQLVVKLRATLKNVDEDPIMFRGDRQVAYGKVSEVIDAVKKGGYKKFRFMGTPEDILKGPARQR